MKNLVLGSACWSKKDNSYNFVKSLRRCYSDDIFLIVNKNLDSEANKFFDKYKVNRIITNIEGKKIQKERFRIFLDFLSDNTFDRVLISDTRDVVFQKNPFQNNTYDKLNFFFEDNIIEKCVHNSRWIKKIYGKKIYDEIKHNWISCSGTTFGNNDEIIKYLNRMVYHMDNYKYFSFFRFPHDQGWHNFIIHKESFLKFKKFFNRDGLIATLSQSNTDDFIFSDFLKTKDGKTYDIIHQYDRKNFFNLMPDILKNLVK